MRIHVLPILVGFFLLGALSHEGVNLIKGQDASVATPAPMGQAGAPRQPPVLAEGMSAADMDIDAAHAGGVAPSPAFVPEQDGDRCAGSAPVRDGQQICVWAI